MILLLNIYIDWDQYRLWVYIKIAYSPKPSEYKKNNQLHPLLLNDNIDVNNYFNLNYILNE